MEADIFIFLLWEIMGKFWEVSICPKFPQEKTVKLYHLLQLIGAENVSATCISLPWVPEPRKFQKGNLFSSFRYVFFYFVSLLALVTALAFNNLRSPISMLFVAWIKRHLILSALNWGCGGVGVGGSEGPKRMFSHISFRKQHENTETCLCSSLFWPGL